MTDMERAMLVHYAALADGLEVFPQQSRGHVSIQRGYSFLRVRESCVDARKEGVGKVGTLPIRIEYSDPQWEQKCVDILWCGRTVECGEGVGLREINQRVHYNPVNYGLGHLDPLMDQVDMDADYQRGHVWTFRQQMKFVGFLLEGGRPPLVFLQEWPDTDVYEVLDGKQRLTACFRFLDGTIPAELSDGRKLRWRDFNEIDRRFAPDIVCGILKLPTRADVLRFYLKLNSGGTVHTENEIKRVRELLEAEAELVTD